MMTYKPASLLIAMICAGMLHLQAADVPFACNLKALNAAEREHLREFSQKLPKAVVASTELADGYTLTMDPAQLGFTEAAEWVSLERRCCPFFDFQLDFIGAENVYRVTLRGREGVKAFMVAEFAALKLKGS